MNILQLDCREAAAALESLARERDEKKRELDWRRSQDKARQDEFIGVQVRAERAEAERDTLRAIVRAADALRIELFPHGVCCKCEHCVLVVAYDRARAKWGGES